MARSLERRLADLRADPSPANVRDALRSASGYLIASAARHATVELADDLGTAFARLVGDVKRDPGCRGKVAIARAFHDLDYWHEAVFSTGVRCVQLEPSMGGPVDTAGELRGVCGLSYAHFARDEALDVLGEMLADPDRNAQLGAARGLGDAGRRDASALLRYKLVQGDAEPEVLAACCESLLHLGDAVEFLIRLLAHADGRAEAAALALGGARDARAAAPLVAFCEACTPEQRDRVGYLALALLRVEPATAHLLEVVRDGSAGQARAAGKALATFKEDAALAARLREAAATRDRSFRAEIEALLV